jgi:hypothetical protein
MYNWNWSERQAIDPRAEDLRREWNRNPGSGRPPDGRPPEGRRPPGWVIFGIGIALLVLSAINFGADASRALGDDTRGYFVAQAQKCDAYGCAWRGQFKLPGGRVILHNVSFDGSEASMHAGSVVPALDSGDPRHVLALHGNVSWLGDLAIGSAGALLTGWQARKWARRLWRRYRAG